MRSCTNIDGASLLDIVVYPIIDHNYNINGNILLRCYKPFSICFMDRHAANNCSLSKIQSQRGDGTANVEKLTVFPNAGYQ